MIFTQNMNLKLAGLAIGAGAVLVGCDDGKMADYIVRENICNTIIYVPMTDPTAIHAIIYDADAGQRDGYNYIRPGDTISGRAFYLNWMSVPARRPGGPGAMRRVPTIELVNGKPVAEMRAMRDSIISAPVQKQK